MNAAIRAVVRTANYYDLHVFGINRGYEGMINGDLHRLDSRDVANIIHRGGTILKTARSERFRTPEGRKAAYEALMAYDIDACIAIGGDGTLTGAKLFTEEYPMPFIGIPGTIDNDLFGTDYTIGYDTAVNTAVEAVDRIRDTADSHNRLSFIEVMGRNAGYIALSTAIGGGAEAVLLPEEKMDINALVTKLNLGAKKKKLFSVVIVAEGFIEGGAQEVARLVKERFDYYDTKVTIIGHLQRGGSPSRLDRLIASRLGFSAVEMLLKGDQNIMVGIVKNQIVGTPFEDAITKSKVVNEELIRMAEILAT